MTDETARPIDEGAPISTPDPIDGTVMTPEVDDAAVERALRAGLDDFELSPEDQALLDAQGPLSEDGAAQGPLPVVAVVGRPNVGKSSLVNRILRRREAVVEDVPGVTRDRVSYEAEWGGRRFTIVDTGGWEADATGIHLRVAEQAEIAIDLADVVMFVVDATVGATDDDEAVVKLLRRSGKPVVLVANKVDDQRGEADAAMLWSLGLGQPFPVSAVHGRGSGDALDAVLEVLPDVSAHGAYAQGGPRRVALVGRPNVGKSSLLNRLAGEERVVVDNVAGTTRDPVDELIELGGKTWRFVDTAGIRRRVHQSRGADFYASLRTQTALEKAEVAVVLIDAEEPIAEQDIRVVQQVIDSGRALVIAYNKWDTLDEERRYYLEREIEKELVQVPWARGPTSPPAPVGTWTASCPRSRPRSSPGTPVSPPAGSTRSWGRSWLPTRTRCEVASSRASSSRPRPRRVRPASSSSRPASSRRLPPVHRAPTARAVRLRGHAHRGLGARPREASPLTSGRRRGPRGPIGTSGTRCATVPFAPRGIRAVAQLGSALDWGQGVAGSNPVSPTDWGLTCSHRSGPIFILAQSLGSHDCCVVLGPSLGPPVENAVPASIRASASGCR